MRRESDIRMQFIKMPEDGRRQVSVLFSLKTELTRMALGLGVTSYGLMSYELLFFNTDHQMYVYKT